MSYMKVGTVSVVFSADALVLLRNLVPDHDGDDSVGMIPIC